MTELTASRAGRANSTPERRLLVLGSAAVLDPLLEELGEPFASVVRARTWDELFGLLVREHPGSVALVEPGPNDGEPDDGFWELLARFPSVTVVPVITATPAAVSYMRPMLTAGISELIDSVRDSPSVARRRLRSAQARPFKRKLESNLSRFVNADASIVLAAAAEVAVDGGGVGDLARIFDVNPRTVVRWCQRTALPEPRRLQVWMRVLLAAQLLDDPGRTMWDVAVACGYATDRSLRRVVKGMLETDLDVRVLRKTGVFAAAIHSFNEELRKLREDRRRSSVQPGKVVVPMQASEVCVTTTPS